MKVGTKNYFAVPIESGQSLKNDRSDRVVRQQNRVFLQAR